MPLETNKQHESRTSYNSSKQTSWTISDKRVTSVNALPTTLPQIRHVWLTHKRHKQQNFKFYQLIFLHFFTMNCCEIYYYFVWNIVQNTIFYAKSHHIQIYLVHIDNFVTSKEYKTSQFSMAGNLKSKPELSEK